MRIACVLAQDFEDSEFRVPYDELRQAGHEVVIIGQQKGEVLIGDKGRERVTTDLSIDEARSQDFDALFIPGGYSPDKLRADSRFVALVRGFANKPILAICHGPQLLITADMVRGRRMTAWKTVQTDLRNAGAQVSDEEVVVDRNLLTSRNPGDLPAFVSRARQLLGSETSAQAPA